MTKITQQDLNRLIAEHELWLKNNAIGKSPDFSNLDLSGLSLAHATLYHANFENSNLENCNFRYSDLGFSRFIKANLTNANLKAANLFRANLHHTVLKNVITDERTMFYFQLCPEEGSFIGYKKAIASDGSDVLVKLLIPEDAKRNSATSYRCRADKAIVLDITDMNGGKIDTAFSLRDTNFIYETGKYLEITPFDENRWNERSNGVHFFLSKDLAKLY